MVSLGLSAELINSKQLEQIHNAALDLVESTGIVAPHKGLLNRLVGQEGVRILGDRVHFRSDIVEKALTAMKFPPSPPDFSIISGAYLIQVQDIETGAVRPSTSSDLVDLLKLGQQLNICGSPPVRPLDIPEPLQEIAMYKAAWEFSSSRPEPLFDTTPMSDVRTAETIYEMAVTIGKPFSIGMYLISPFICPKEGLDIIEAFLDREVPVWIGTMPVAGLTGPVFMLGAHVQALAELMAGITLVHLLTQGKVPIFLTPIDSVRAHPFDMRYASFVYSSPEDSLGTILQAQINKKYKIPLVAKSLLTSALHPDEQAGAEKMAHTLIAALAGARIFTNAGFLAVDNYVSGVQVLIDCEIVTYIKHLLGGIDFSSTALSLDVIKEVAAGQGTFIEHPSTYKHFRKTAWDPDLFRHIPYKDSSQAVPLWQEARQRVQAMINEADYILPESDRRILARLYQRAERYFYSKTNY